MAGSFVLKMAVLIYGEGQTSAIYAIAKAAKRPVFRELRRANKNFFGKPSFPCCIWKTAGPYSARRRNAATFGH
jgi:hypothetical protein